MERMKWNEWNGRNGMEWNGMEMEMEMEMEMWEWNGMEMEMEWDD